jgi:hypothetical protein
MTNWNILLEPATNGQTTATVLELPALQVTANTRQLALDKIQQLIIQRFANAEVVTVAVPTPPTENPWLKFGGIFRDDSDFDEIAQALQAEREQST